MTDLTETEKRRLLRERRQKKFSNGGASSRLNKITGQASSHLNAESPLDSPSTETTTPVESLRSSTPDNREDKNTAPQLDLLKQLAAMQAQGAGTDPALDSSTPDLLSLLSSMNGGMPSAEGTPSLGQAPPLAGINQAALDYHDYLLNRLKAWTILVKWVFFLLPYLYLITRPSTAMWPADAFTQSSWFAPLRNPSNFTRVFGTFEFLSISIYYQLLKNVEHKSKIRNLQDTNKLVKLVSLVPEGVLPIPNLKGKLVTVLQYWDLLSMLITDISFVLIVLGLLTYL
ncbi:rmd7p [Saccharomyces arboricola H-6]|uniref:Golgi to ER traffic protein 2 n=1 Tax=Saccharomyces arboricola (strain H-6 / AS 2.3317 / CBS 10644) TaxID=1160507 RepID=J8Q8Q1_SACAR|nr:rmd7p [Saccharomyces arboricola H-6]